MNVLGNITFVRGKWGGAIAALAAAGIGSAALGAPDRDNTTPTGWWWLSNALATDIQDYVDNGWRPIDLEPIAGTSPQRFVAAFVADQGAYDKAFWWDDDATEAGVNSVLSNNNARLIDLEPYEVGGVIRYAYVAIANSGSDFSPANWWIAGRTEQQVRDFAQANNARIIDADYYVEGGATKYAAVLVPNSGGGPRGTGGCRTRRRTRSPAN